MRNRTDAYSISRRHLLRLLAASPLIGACGHLLKNKRIGLALGGGGAKGLAHILIFEALEELGLRPHRIAGTSIGSVMGLMYASGMRSKDIRAVIDQLTVSKGESFFDSLFNEKILKFLDFLDLRDSSGGLINTQAFVEFLLTTVGKRHFGELEIPLKVVATDFWRREELVFSRGELAPAIAASIAIPGFFAPVEHNGRALVDGGLVNPVPWDHVMDDCDITIAVDVIGSRERDGRLRPSYFETAFNAMQIMQATINRKKLEINPPDIYIKPDIRAIRVLEFYKFEQIFQQSQTAKASLKRQLKFHSFW